MCARVCFQGDDINLVVAAERKKKGFTYSYTAHTAIKMVSPFLCVLILFLRPLASFKYYSRRWPTKSNPQRQGEWRYRLILIPLFPSTLLLLSHSVCVCVMCLSSLFAMALTVKPHWKGDAAWWGSLVSGEGKNERSPPTPPALRLKKKTLNLFRQRTSKTTIFTLSSNDPSFLGWESVGNPERTRRLLHASAGSLPFRSYVLARP